MPKSKVRNKIKKPHKAGKVWSKARERHISVFQTVFDGMLAAKMITEDGRSLREKNTVYSPDKDILITTPRQVVETEDLRSRAARAGLYLP